MCQRSNYPYLQEEGGRYQGEFSSDGRWVAYHSDESGRYEVYIQSFHKPAGRLQVSTSGGAEPHWRRDGKELFFIGLDSSLMSAPVKIGETLEVGTPQKLFGTDILVDATDRQYAVTGAGQRFLLVTPLAGQTASPITVVLNWTAGLKK